MPNVIDFFSPDIETKICVGLLQVLHTQVEQDEAELTQGDLLVLLENTVHPDCGVREECLLLISQSSPLLGRIAALSRLLDDFAPVRICALELLEFDGAPEDRHAVEQVLANDPAWEVRASAVSCLARMAGAEAKAAVIAALDDADAGVRRYAAVALSRIADAADIEVLQQAEAWETEAGARTGIYSALYKLGDGSYLPKLTALLDTDAADPDVVNVTCQVLSGFGDYLFPGDVPFVRAQLAVLDTTCAHPEVRIRIAKLLDTLATPD